VIQAQPMIVLDHVEAGSRWFQAVLGLTSGHGGSEYEMLMSGDALVAQLHRWDSHEHAHLGDRTNPSRGNGALLWFATDDFDEVVRRAEAHDVEFLEGPHFNESAHQHEMWLRGPEGYVVVIAGPRVL
jgi:hypothetical protein